VDLGEHRLKDFDEPIGDALEDAPGACPPASPGIRIARVNG